MLTRSRDLRAKTPDELELVDKELALARDADVIGNGWGWMIDDIAVTAGSMGLADGDEVDHPNAKLLTEPVPARPNPFSPSTTISFSIGEDGPVALTLFDSRGRIVRRLVEWNWAASRRFEVSWDGRDDRGRRVTSGVYLVQLRTQNARRSQKVMLAK